MRPVLPKAIGRRVGGLIGEVSASVTFSYSKGFVSGSQGTQVGGLIGAENLDYVGNWSYWDRTTSKTDQGTGEGNVTFLTALTSAELKSGLPAHFDPSIWGEKKSINNASVI